LRSRLDFKEPVENKLRTNLSDELCCRAAAPWRWRTAWAGGAPPVNFKDPFLQIPVEFSRPVLNSLLNCKHPVETPLPGGTPRGWTRRRTRAASCTSLARPACRRSASAKPPPRWAARVSQARGGRRGEDQRCGEIEDRGKRSPLYNIRHCQRAVSGYGSMVMRPSHANR
jgi:hypothetical protein